MQPPARTRKYTASGYGAQPRFNSLSDLDDVEDIQQWRKADVEIAPMAEHEPLRSDLLCFALIDARTQPLATYLTALALET